MLKLVKNNQRHLPRRLASKSISVSIATGNHVFSAAVVNYNPTGLSLRFENSAVEAIKQSGTQLKICLAGQFYGAALRHVRADIGAAIAGFALKGSATESPHRFLSGLATDDTIDNPELIEDLFERLVFFNSGASIMELRQFRGRVTITPTLIRDSRFLVGTIHSWNGDILEPEMASCRFELFQTCYAFQVQGVQQSGNTVTMELPKRIVRMLRRHAARTRHFNQLHVEIFSKTLGLSPAQIRLYDFSENGISILDPTGWSGAPTGLPLESIALITPEGTQIRGHGIVKGHRWSAKDEQYVIGIQFEPADRIHRKAWHEFIVKARYPHFEGLIPRTKKIPQYMLTPR